MNQSEIKFYKTYFIIVATVISKLTGVPAVQSKLAAEFEKIIKLESMIASSDKVEDSSLLIRSESKLDLNQIAHKIFSKNPNILTEQIIIAKNNIFFSKLTAVLELTDTRTIAYYFCWRLIYSMSPYTTKMMRDIRMIFNNIAFDRESEFQKEICVANTVKIFDKALASKFVEKFLNKNSKARVEALVENVRRSHEQLLNQASWMDEETRKGSVKKLAAMMKFVAYPDWIFNQSRVEHEYVELVTIPGDYFGNLLATKDWITKKGLVEISRNSTETSGLFFNPLKVNAFYDPFNNLVSIPAAILQPPFYRENGLTSLNYGGIGTAVSHEIGHGFDPLCIQYDSEGNQNNWLTQSSRTKYQTIVECFTQEIVAGGWKGKGPVDENIADNIGLRAAYYAYLKSIKDKNEGKEEQRLPGLELYSPQQLFFLGYANNWCETVSQDEEVVRIQLSESSHPNGFFRVVLPLRNFHEFGQQWECPFGSSMTLPEKERCILW